MQELGTCKKTTDRDGLPMIKFELSAEVSNFGKLDSPTMNLKGFQHLNTFQIRSVVIFVDFFLILYNRLYQRLEEMYNSVN